MADRSVHVGAFLSAVSGAWLASQGLVALVACSGPPSAPAPEAPGDRGARAAAAREKSAAPILRNNPFDSAHVRLEGEADPGNVQSARCEDVEVHAVIAADPEWSFASLAVRGGKPVLRRVGGQVGARRVAFVGADHVMLEANGSMCRADLFRVSPEKALDQGAVARPVAATPGIERVSDREYRIDRGARDRILEAQGELLGTAQIAAAKIDGKVVGMQIVRLKPGSVLESLGLRAGDCLAAVNGFDLTTPESGLMAYARLRDAPVLNLTIVRDGRTQEVRYEVR